MYKARNVDDFMEVINQALFEVEDLILCAGDEGDGDTQFSAMTPDLRVIEAGLKALHAEILGGGYAIGRGETCRACPWCRKCASAQAPANRGSDRRHQQRAQDGLRA